MLSILDGIPDDHLATFWKFSGMGDLTGDPDRPYPGREEVARLLPKFLQPIIGSWRDVLRRAVRTMPARRDLAGLLALLRQIVSGYRTPVPHPAPTPAALASQVDRISTAPTRGSPAPAGGPLPRARPPA